MERSAVRLLLLAVIVAGCGGSSSQDETVEVGEQTEDTTWADSIDLVPPGDVIFTPNDSSPVARESSLPGEDVRIPAADSRPLDRDDAQPGESCDPNYDPCVPVVRDVDCAGGTGDGPLYVEGPVRVVGYDRYKLDRDGDGIGCDR